MPKKEIEVKYYDNIGKLIVERITIHRHEVIFYGRTKRYNGILQYINLGYSFVSCNLHQIYGQRVFIAKDLKDISNEELEGIETNMLIRKLTNKI
jgi:hypothetical protein